MSNLRLCSAATINDASMLGRMTRNEEVVGSNHFECLTYSILPNVEVDSTAGYKTTLPPTKQNTIPNEAFSSFVDNPSTKSDMIRHRSDQRDVMIVTHSHDDICGGTSIPWNTVDQQGGRSCFSAPCNPSPPAPPYPRPPTPSQPGIQTTASAKCSSAPSRPRPQITVLKRPTGNQKILPRPVDPNLHSSSLPSQNGPTIDVVSNSTSVPIPPGKTLEERELEYTRVRNRIFGTDANNSCELAVSDCKFTDEIVFDRSNAVTELNGPVLDLNSPSIPLGKSGQPRLPRPPQPRVAANFDLVSSGGRERSGGLVSSTMFRDPLHLHSHTPAHTISSEPMYPSALSLALEADYLRGCSVANAAPRTVPIPHSLYSAAAQDNSIAPEHLPMRPVATPLSDIGRSQVLSSGHIGSNLHTEFNMTNTNFHGRHIPAPPQSPAGFPGPHYVNEYNARDAWNKLRHRQYRQQYTNGNSSPEHPDESLFGVSLCCHHFPSACYGDRSTSYPSCIGRESVMENGAGSYPHSGSETCSQVVSERLNSQNQSGNEASGNGFVDGKAYYAPLHGTTDQDYNFFTDIDMCNPTTFTLQTDKPPPRFRPTHASVLTRPPIVDAQRYIEQRRLYNQSDLRFHEPCLHSSQHQTQQHSGLVSGDKRHHFLVGPSQPQQPTSHICFKEPTATAPEWWMHQ